MNRYFSYLILFLVMGGFFAACSAERHNPFAKVYQNTTARYNAFFLGNERLKAMEAEVAAKTIPDYNHILPIFTVIDSAAAVGLRKELDEIIKKASYPIQKHPSSDWTDDSYLLIGKSRFYGREFNDAIQTFKYVNSTSRKEETRHEALVWLMRSFVTTGDLESAKAVSDLMKKQFLTRENALLLFLTRAQYHLLREEVPLSIENLKLGIPLIDKKDEEARVRFILAQLYQQTSQNKLAYQQYVRILRKTPPYELGFQSKLRLGQVTELNNVADREKIEKYFKKLEKDAKNKEYLDKIYYERAQVELKQNKVDAALAYLNQSIRASTKNAGQKGYSYLLAGQIYYDKLQKYRLAQNYYDSAVQVLPPTAADYTAAAERRDVLNDFANNLGTIEREDSLLALAGLSQADLDKRLTDIMTLAEEKKAADAKRAADVAANPKTGNNASPNLAVTGANNINATTGTTAAQNNNAGALWYFDNPVTMASARAEFIRRWGNRQLQDNWRTSNQQTNSPQPDQAATNTAGPTGTPEEAAAQQDAFRATLMQDIPFTPAQKSASNEKIEEAYFALANIYRLRLKEPAKAIETYEKLLARFPQTKHAAETYYTLYLMYREVKDPKQNTYAGLIKQQFPNSRYAKLIDQPDYLTQVSQGNVKVREMYDSAFVSFEKKQYPAASNILNSIRQQYPDSDLNDKVAFLGVRIIGVTEQPVLFKMALQQFLNTYPASPLSEKARQYLSTVAAFESGKLSEAEFDKTHPPKMVPVADNRPAATAQPTPAAEKAVLKPELKTNTAQPVTLPKATPEVVKTNSTGKANTAGTPPVTNNTATNNPGPVTPPVTAETAPKPTFSAPDAQSPQVVVVAYPKGNAAFTGVVEKVQGYNAKYNAADKLAVEAAPLNASQDLVIVRAFANSQKAKSYVIKQKSPQSPLSKIRGIEFVTFVISSENLALLLQNGKLEEYLTFYKNNY